MIISFQVTNFRSIRDTFEFTLIAESGQSKPENVFQVEIAGGQTLRLLKSAVIYGPNASGKTNFIRALFNLTEFIKRSREIRAESPIRFYEPFLFDTASETAPSKFSIEFLLPDEGTYIRHIYQLEFNRTEVLHEELDYYPKGQPHNLFKREANKDPSSILHTGRLGKSLGYKEYPLFRNQLFLSQFGGEIPHEMLTGIYLYFDSVEVWNALAVNRVNTLREQIAEELLLPENQHLRDRLNKLIRIADTRIDSIIVQEGKPLRPKEQPEPSSSETSASWARAPHQITAAHTVFDQKKATGVKVLPLREESAGTNVLFALGGIILKRLERGGVLFFDELDNSLHPKLSKFLVRLFNNPKTNSYNAQLILATHEVTLLDKDVFRKDQIWFCEKDEFGATDIFSAKEFEGVRDDTPFDKWYMNGKFGGHPKIKELEFIFSNE